MKQGVLSLQLSDPLTFKNFYASCANAPIVEYLKKIQSKNDFLFEDQMIYLAGPKNSGLTHLLKACSAQIENHYYFSYKNSLQNNMALNAISDPVSGPSYCEKLDLICLDDIELISDNPEEEKRLFNLYNQLKNQQKTVLILGSHYLPSELSLKLPDLKSRLQSMLLLLLKDLSDDEKIEALKLRANIRGFELSHEVGEYLLRYFPRSLSDLFQILDKLDQSSLEEKRRLTIPFVKEVFLIR